MALLDRIPEAHTVGAFRRAARLRYAEAKRSVEAGDRLIGIYLAGYAAEMTLKAAYFRTIGKRSTDRITLDELRGIKKQARASLGILWPGNLHDLPQWAGLLVEERKFRGAPYGLAFASQLVGQVAQIYANWREDLRYHENRPRTSEVAQVFSRVDWLFANESRLAP